MNGTGEIKLSENYSSSSRTTVLLLRTGRVPTSRISSSPRIVDLLMENLLSSIYKGIDEAVLKFVRSLEKLGRRLELPINELAYSYMYELEVKAYLTVSANCT